VIDCAPEVVGLTVYAHENLIQVPALLRHASLFEVRSFWRIGEVGFCAFIV